MRKRFADDFSGESRCSTLLWIAICRRIAASVFVCASFPFIVSISSSPRCVFNFQSTSELRNLPRLACYFVLQRSPKEKIHLLKKNKKKCFYFFIFCVFVFDFLKINLREGGKLPKSRGSVIKFNRLIRKRKINIQNLMGEKKKTLKKRIQKISFPT